VAEIIGHHFNLLRYEFHVFRSRPDPFLVIFSDRASRDVVFARGRVLDGPVDLRFHSWEADRFGERVLIPYHVKISLEGLSQHAWSLDTTERVLGDEALIHHVDQASRRREDFRYYVCWAFSQNPSRIPQLVYLTLSDRLGDPRLDAQLHFSRPCNVRRGQLFMILVHIESVEDLQFYHHSPEQLNAEGKVQLRELRWRLGHPDGDIEEEVERTSQRYCRPILEPRRRPREDDDEDRGRSRPRSREPLRGVSRWVDNRRRDRGVVTERDRGRN
jgi:hypothetical protein